MHFRRLIMPMSLTIAAAASCWPGGAMAQLKEEQSWCAGGGGASAEIRIQGCTAVIESGRGSSKQQSFTFKSRGDAYYQRREYDRALQDYDQAIKLNARYSDAFDRRCWTLATVDKLADALKDCKEALRLRANFAPALNTLGLVYLRLGQFDDAISSYSAALQADPKSAYALYGRGTAKLKKGDSAGGAADIAASKAIKDVAAEMGGYGVK
jgi:tetratricopeptide (TPR) repeat protein